MSKFRMPKINSIRFGAAWIVISLVIGILLPAVIWIVTGAIISIGYNLFDIAFLFCIHLFCTG